MQNFPNNELVRLLDSVGAQRLSEGDYRVNYLYFSTLNELLGDALTLKEIFAVSDYYSDVALGKLPAVALLTQSDRITGLCRLMTEDPRLTKLSDEKREILAFAIDYAFCTKYFDEAKQTILNGIAELSSLANLMKQYDIWKEARPELFLSTQAAPPPVSGEFGYSKDNPIQMVSVRKSYEYLRRLRAKDGEIISCERVGSVGTNSTGHIIDLYEIKVKPAGGTSATRTFEIYIDAYAQKPSYIAPEHFIYADETLTSEGCHCEESVKKQSHSVATDETRGIEFSEDKKDAGQIQQKLPYKEYVIPDGVTAIGDRAFAGCERLTSVTIPSSVTYIGGGAFEGCASVTIPEGATEIGGEAARWRKNRTIREGTIETDGEAFCGCASVKIPSSVTTINNGAFAGARRTDVDKVNPSFCSDDVGALFDKERRTLLHVPSDVSNYAIPEGVTDIGQSAFEGCTSLTSVTIPSSVKTIGMSAFEKCKSLRSVTIPEGVKIIEINAFAWCTSLTSVTIPSSVTDIDWSAFAFSGLTSVTIPPSVTAIGQGAFAGCENLTSVTIPPSVTDIGEGAFEGCENLRNVTILPGVTDIGAGAFEVCPNLTSVTIPPSVTAIGQGAFADCSSLTSVTIPSSVKTIDKYAFAGCRNLRSVTIPPSVTDIGAGAFEGCQKVKVSQYNWTFFADTRGALIDREKRTLLYLPPGFSGAYAIPDGVTAIGDRAFAGCERLTSVTIPSSVTDIGEGAFEGCENLTSVTIPPSVTAIGKWAFDGCPCEESVKEQFRRNFK